MHIVRSTEYHIAIAAQKIVRGDLVAFPTETVYGLGANVFDARAVQKIFAAKGRPSDNPLIVHIGNINDLSRVAVDVPTLAYKFIEKFWPGPLTLVLPRNKDIPDIVSAGLPTVAVRLPAHRVAQILIRASGVPIAAPSANISGRPSPTIAEHVAEDFFNKNVYILDGGAASYGIESTVLDMTVLSPVILRNGSISLEALRRVDDRVLPHAAHSGAVCSPGMKYRHYAPRAPLVIARCSGRAQIREIYEFVAVHAEQRVGILASAEYESFYKNAFTVLVVGSRRSPRLCARSLFTVLRKFDTLKVDYIIAENFPEHGIGAAFMDRLRRAAFVGVPD